MRKIVSLMLAAVLLLSMSISSAATQPVKTETGEVTANYVKGAESGQIISVNIAWEGMTFTYHGESEKKWDPVNHVYLPAEEAYWDSSNAKITVTNDSDMILKADIAYTQKSGYEDMYLAFTDTKPYIGSADAIAEGMTAGKACAVEIKAVPMGSLKPDTPADAVVGEIKVTMTTVENAADVLTDISKLYSKVPVGSANVERGECYFALAQDKSDVDTLYMLASLDEEDPDISKSARNASLNAMLTAYYNKLCLKQ